MKTFIILIIFTSFFSIVKTEAQNYGLDNTDPAVFTKFRIPSTDLRSLWLNTNLHFNSNKDIYSRKQEPYAEFLSNDYRSNFNYSLSPQYLLLHESEDMYFTISANLNGTYEHNYSSNENNQSVSSDKSKQNYYSAIINISMTLNDYIKSSSFFYSAGSSISVNMNQTKSDQISSPSSGNYRNSKSQNYSISLGVGFGKLRNVTPVVTAVRFQERMKQLSLINNDLSDKTIEDLAMQFFKQPYYSDVYSRPDKYFWKGIDHVLSNDAVSLQGLNMYASSYLRESLNEVRFFRQEGLVAGLNLQLKYYNFYDYPMIIMEDLTLGFNPYFSFSRQVSLNSQVSFSASLTGGPVISKHSNTRQNYAFSVRAGYNYELTDRLVCLFGNNFGYNIVNSSEQNKSWSDALNLNLSYFVEDNIVVSASYNWSYYHSNSQGINSNLFSSTSENLYNTLDLGFTYYFDKGFIIN
ncbi:MAG: hypothetical protein WCE54_03040 [Ignavibacteriaceae bacterium]